jgi:two-component sensor histidine kinase/CheY-like chemotaxis protein
MTEESDPTTILLVEDQALIALDEQESLERGGYRVRIAHSGEEAVELFEADGEINLVLMDIDLGRGMSGTEAAHRILQRREVPLLFLTAHAEGEMVEKVKSITRYGYVLKSSGEFVLLSSVDMALQLFREMSARKQHETQLKRRAEFERLISELSSRFVRIDPEEVDGEIYRSLEKIGRCKGADRAYVFLFRGHSTVADNTHEWCAPGVTREIDNLKGLEVEGTLPRFYRTMAARQVYSVEDVEALPGRYGNERRLFLDEDIRSLVVVPMLLGERVIGFLGFDAVREHRTWSQDDRSLLQLTGEIFSHALERRRVDREMRHRLGMERTLVEISSSFVGIGDEELDAAVHDALQNIGSYAGIDRSYLFLLRSGGKRMDNTHEWCAEGITPQKEHLQGIHVESLPWLGARLKTLETVNIPSVDDLPEEAKEERKHFRVQGIRSLAVVPIILEGEYGGFLGFDTVRSYRVLSEEDIALLRTVGEIITAALERVKAEREIAALLDEKEYLLREVHHRIKNDMHMIRSLLSLQTESVTSPEGREALREAVSRVGVMQDIYNTLYRRHDVSTIELKDFLSDLAADLHRSHVQNGRIRLEMDAERMELSAREALSLGIVVNELVSNAFKYAFPEAEEGTVRVRVCGGEEGDVVAEVRDDGVGPPPEVLSGASKGFGLSLIDMIVRQHEGTWELSADFGTRTRVKLPLK